MLEADNGCIIDSLHLCEVYITNPVNANPYLKVDYVLMSRTDKSSTTIVHGRNSTETLTWSERTRELLIELMDSVESDLLPYHFNTGEGLEADDARTQLGGIEKTPQI